MAGIKGTGFGATPAPSSATAGDDTAESIDVDEQELDSASQRFQDKAAQRSSDQENGQYRSDSRRPTDRDKSKRDDTRSDLSPTASERRLFEQRSFEERQEKRKRAMEEVEDAALAALGSQGDRVLRGLQGLSSDGVVQAGQADPAQSSLSEVIEKLADRILVSQPQAGQSEVRIKLNMESLTGTEAALMRDAYGLSVRFAAASADAARLLEAGLPQLQRILDRHELDHHNGDPVRIKVEQNEASDGSPAHSDGRSRNRRDLRDELLDQG